MFTTDGQVLIDIAALLKLANGPSDLPPYWTTVVSLCHQRAYDDIVQILLGRGYAITDIINWGTGNGSLSAGIVYERSLAMFYSVCDGGDVGSADDKFLQRLDCRKRLETLTMFDQNGQPILSEQGNLGTVGTGPANDWCGPIEWPRERLSQPGNGRCGRWDGGFP